MRQNKFEYDAFISHAVEDKIPIANELCAKLEMAGLKIWYSGKELGIGDSIEKTIEKGLNRSRYGIVIFSPTYLAKNWTIREFYTLLAKEIEEQKVILPVLYNISLDELKNKDLLMADRFAVNADKGIDFVVERLVKEITKSQPVKPKLAWFSTIWLVLILSLLANVALLLKNTAPGKGVETLSEGNLSVAPLRAQTMKASLLAEMQDLLKRFSTCSCTQSGSSPRNTARTVQLVSNSDRAVTDNFNDADAGSGQHSVTKKTGSKMTMAVIFQVETGPQGQGLEEEMDEMMQTISLPEKEQPFVMASNRGVNHREGAEHQCSHTSYRAE